MPDKQFIDEIVKAHNEYRSRHQVRHSSLKLNFKATQRIKAK